MRTPGILIFGLVMAPCGWILDLTSTVATNWRTISNVAGQSSDLVVGQGIWDTCLISTSSQAQTCNQKTNDPTYFSSQIISIAQGMMVASLVVTVIGLIVATPGVRCWRERPRWVLAAMGGLLIFFSGALAIIPVAYYTYLLKTINSTYVVLNPSNAANIQVGYCIVLGYIGGCMEVLGGLVMFIGICSCCGGRNRGEKPRSHRERHHTRPTPLPRISMPRSDSRHSEASSVPYSRDSLQEEMDFPRAKSRPPPPRQTTTSHGRKPYDVDL